MVKNVEMTVGGDILLIKVDLTRDFAQSKSGETILVGPPKELSPSLAGERRSG
jgi:hypothetical protein